MKTKFVIIETSYKGEFFLEIEGERMTQFKRSDNTNTEFFTLEEIMEWIRDSQY